MKKIAALLLSFSLLTLTATTGLAQQGYEGVIAGGNKTAAPAAAAPKGGYNGVTSWDSLVSDSLYDFVNEAGLAMQGSASSGESGAGLGQLLRKQRAAENDLFVRKAAIEKQMQDEYRVARVAQFTKQMEEARRQWETPDTPTGE